ncbi:MAG: hypothetical protein A4E59_00258 [Syntrophorhabdus sp. PtaB.Bin027]|nr:MAG: hypothetical protein A4E59_00258 [Syntrophorhabdus sp. PtaB.Bin027]
MLNLLLIVLPLVGLVLLLIFSKLKLKSWKYYYKFNWVIFFLAHLLIIALFVINYSEAYFVYPQNILEISKEAMTEVVLYYFKVMIIFILFNLSYIFLTKKR